MYSFGIMMAEVVMGWLVIDSPVPQRAWGSEVDSRHDLVTAAAVRLASCPAFKAVIESCSNDDASARMTASAALDVLKDAVSRCCHPFVYSAFPCPAAQLHLPLLSLTCRIIVD